MGACVLVATEASEIQIFLPCLCPRWNVIRARISTKACITASKKRVTLHSIIFSQLWWAYLL